MDSRTTRRLRTLASHLSVDADGLSLARCSSSSSSSKTSVAQQQQQKQPETGPQRLEKERSGASFDVRQMTYLLDGSEKYTTHKELMALQIENDPFLNDPRRADRTLKEARETTMKKIKQSVDLWNSVRKIRSSEEGGTQAEREEIKTIQAGSTSKTLTDAFWEVMGMYDPSWATRIGVHYGLFGGAITGQGTAAQRQLYEPLIAEMRIFGCFAMTELGHGSYVAGLETTATYEHQTQEFIIHSPTLTSTKWWIGAAGQTATHAVVFAQLIINDRKFGIHNFIVPLRSLEDGTPLPGITIGDCGAKMGRNGIDNGFIRFNQIRIPRENMLARWASVSPEGEYVQPPKRQLAYGALIGGRVSMVKESSDYLKKALTIAIRYSAVRKQFPAHDGEDDEVPILNYQTHQHRLFPLLASTYAIHFAAEVLKSRYHAMQADLNEENLSSLAGVHATSAGLKAFCTWWANSALEICRQCLGGHGYSAYSGFTELLGDFAVQCTWEGDNTVLSQQAARYLIKQLRRSYKNRKLNGFESYLDDAEATLSTGLAHNRFPVKTEDQLKQPRTLLLAHKYVAVKLIVATEARLTKTTARFGGSKTRAWSECMVDLIECARAHCNYFISNSFVEILSSSGLHPSLKDVLNKLCLLHSLTLIETNSAQLFQEKYMSSPQLELVRRQIRALYKDIRTQAVPLVDSFNIPDIILNTPLGHSDGNIYEKYMEVVQTNPESVRVPDYHSTLIKPLISGMGFEEN